MRFWLLLRSTPRHFLCQTWVNVEFRLDPLHLSISDVWLLQFNLVGNLPKNAISKSTFIGCF